MQSFRKNRQRALVILLVIAVIAYLAVDIVYRLIELNTPAFAPEPQAAAVAPAPDMTKNPLGAYAVIVERNLFRTTDRPIVVDQTDPNSLEATSLQLDLYGTIAGEDGKGYAIIEERDKKRQRLYKVGDNVAGAMIVRIARNAVVLRMGEKEQVLKKKETAPQGGDRRLTASPTDPSGRTVPPGAAPQPGSQARSQMGAPGSPPDLANLLTQARVTPNITAGSSGRPDGVVIQEIQPGSIFESAGLINGDVIQEVNGRTVTGVVDLVSMYRDLKPGASLSIKVTRTGRQVVLNHTVE